MAKHFAIKSDPAGHAADEDAPGWTGAPDELTRVEAEAWEALLVDWRAAYEAIAAFSRFEEGTMKAESRAALEQLCDLERRARERVDGFLRSLG